MHAVSRLLVIAALVLTTIGHEAAQAAAPDKLLVFVTPGATVDAVWMADTKGLFTAEGLDVQLRPFPSGTTAMQTFQTGAGDIIFTGDLPSLQYWQRGGDYRVIAPMERDAKSYIGIVRNDIHTAKDLAGKTLATRVGSTGSWFISDYLTKNDVPESAVTVRNLDPPLMPTALCRGDIDGFFLWEPAPSKALTICGDKVHVLTTAEGYVKGYNVIGARASALATPKGAEVTTRFLRALRKGADAAAHDLPTVTSYLENRFGLTETEIHQQEAVMERVLKMDATFFQDFCSENQWQQHAGLRSGPSDLAKWTWPDGLRAIDPTLVTPAPPPC